MESRLVWSVEAQLGEGPIWLGKTGALWFVDIEGGALHCLEPGWGARRSFAVGGQPSFIVPASDGTLLVGMGDTIRSFTDGVLGDPIARIDMPAHNRTNDATVDPSGRLWFGTMDNGQTLATGAVHLFDGQSIREVGGACAITNGPAVSPDGGFLYHVDTVGRTIWRYDITSTDELEHGEIFVTIAHGEGWPDGVTIDAEGCLWVALWDGWGVRRYSPDGALLLSVAIPCAQVTKVAFGGADLRTAYVTTARTGLSASALERQPLAGGLFAFDAPAPGIPQQAVRLAR